MERGFLRGPHWLRGRVRTTLTERAAHVGELRALIARLDGADVAPAPEPPPLDLERASPAEAGPKRKAPRRR